MVMDDPVDDHDLLLSAIEALPTGLRQAVVLHHLEGLERPVVAARLGCSPSALKKRLQRALAGLRRRLERAGYEDAKLPPLQEPDQIRAIFDPLRAYHDQLARAVDRPHRDALNALDALDALDVPDPREHADPVVRMLAPTIDSWLRTQLRLEGIAAVLGARLRDEAPPADAPVVAERGGELVLTWPQLDLEWRTPLGDAPAPADQAGEDF